MMRRVIAPKRDAVTGEWRKQYNEELNDLYFYPNIFSGYQIEEGWTGNVAFMEESRDVYRILIGKTE
jgi:hypothetical protein